MHDDRIAVITGAAGGIGMGAARKLLQQGRRIVVVDSNADALARVLLELPADRALGVAVDIASPGAAAVIHDRARTWGPVSILVNNAGISPKHNGLAAGLLHMTDAEWARVHDVNVTAGMRLARAFAPDMIAQRWGRIINISSVAGRTHPGTASVAYASTKAAVVGMTRSFAAELSRHGVTANTIAPGYIETPLSATIAPKLLQRIIRKIPVGRAGTPDDMGAAIAFLASDDAGFISGACLDVNGGAVML